MLTLRGITKTFDGRRVLDDLNLEVKAGESVALLGANGSGKTTTLRAVVGLAKPDAGQVTIAGIDAWREPVSARRHISYLPQKPIFPSTLTVRETLMAVAKLRRIGDGAVAREIEECGLASLADRGVGHLSGGERQRLAIGVAFLPLVDIYLFDEPSTNLDPDASRMLFKRARRLKDDGHTLLFTTHVPADVRHLATRIVCLRNGRIDADAEGQFALRRYERRLEHHMWGHDDVDTENGYGAGGGFTGDDRVWDPGAVARTCAG
jgi:ABC-type multidrug transport system ATPase subunit